MLPNLLSSYRNRKLNLAATSTKAESGSYRYRKLNLLGSYRYWYSIWLVDFQCVQDVEGPNSVASWCKWKASDWVCGRPALIILAFAGFYGKWEYWMRCYSHRHMKCSSRIVSTWTRSSVRMNLSHVLILCVHLLAIAWKFLWDVISKMQTTLVSLRCQIFRFRHADIGLE